MLLYGFHLPGFYPALLTIGQSNLLPILHRIVDDGNLRSFMENKQFNAILGRRTLHGDSRLSDNGTSTVDQLTLLLISKDIRADKDDNHQESAKETDLTQPYLIGKEIY